MKPGLAKGCLSAGIIYAVIIGIVYLVINWIV